jgi:hypothetical protein
LIVNQLAFIKKNFLSRNEKTFKYLFFAFISVFIKKAMSHKGLIYFSSSDTEEEINEERVRATVPKNQGSYMDRLKSTSRGVLPGKKLKDDRLKTQQEKPVYHAHEQVRQEQLENASLPDKPVHRQEQSKTQPVHRQEQLENASLPDKPVHRQEEVSNVQEQVRQEQQLEEKSVHRQEDVLPALPKNDNVCFLLAEIFYCFFRSCTLRSNWIERYSLLL